MGGNVSSQKPSDSENENILLREGDSEKQTKVVY